MKRRDFLLGLVGLVAAPAIVRIDNIMPVKLVQWSSTPILSPHGVVTWESYPWTATVDYSKVDPFNIDLDLVKIRCLHEDQLVAEWEKDHGPSPYKNLEEMAKAA